MPTRFSQLVIALLLSLLSFSSTAAQDCTWDSGNEAASEFRVLTAAQEINQRLELSTEQFEHRIREISHSQSQNCVFQANSLMNSGEYSSAAEIMEGSSPTRNNLLLQAAALYLDGQRLRAINMVAPIHDGRNPEVTVAVQIMPYDQLQALELVDGLTNLTHREQLEVYRVRAWSYSVQMEWEKARMEYESLFATGGRFDLNFIKVLTQLGEDELALEIMSNLIAGEPNIQLRVNDLLIRADLYQAAGDTVLANLDYDLAVQITLQMAPEQFETWAGQVGLNAPFAHTRLYPTWLTIASSDSAGADTIVKFVSFVVSGYDLGEFTQVELEQARALLQRFIPLDIDIS